MTLLHKKARMFRQEFIGWDYIYDCDIEIFVGDDNEIQDYSGCDYNTAHRLISEYNNKRNNRIKNKISKTINNLNN